MLGRVTAWLSSLFVPRSVEATAGPRWDARAGVWVGDRAAGADIDIPDPLWIFGYGSLCWRPDFAHEETMVGRVSGWGRYFAQASCDHRGTPESPGLVATLLADADLEARGLRDPTSAPSSTCGLCYRVGAADVARVLDYLDVREKGGYTRALVDVLPAGSDAAGTSGAGASSPVRALVYSATPENPNFLPKMLSDLPAAATTIATAHGPSGANIVYLESLATWLDEVGEHDQHVATIVSHLPAQASSSSK